VVGGADRAVRTSVLELVEGLMGFAARGHGPKGALSRTWPTGSMVLWVAILLGVSLVLYL
jgi:multicomponent Na+:H+ antiporter subunit D